MAASDYFVVGKEVPEEPGGSASHSFISKDESHRIADGVEQIDVGWPSDKNCSFFDDRLDGFGLFGEVIRTVDVVTDIGPYDLQNKEVRNAIRNQVHVASVGIAPDMMTVEEERVNGLGQVHASQVADDLDVAEVEHEPHGGQLVRCLYRQEQRKSADAASQYDRDDLRFLRR